MNSRRSFNDRRERIAPLGAALVPISLVLVFLLYPRSITDIEPVFSLQAWDCAAVPDVGLVWGIELDCSREGERQTTAGDRIIPWPTEEPDDDEWGYVPRPRNYCHPVLPRPGGPEGDCGPHPAQPIHERAV